MISNDLISYIDQLVQHQRLLADAIRCEAHSIWMPGINPQEDEKKAELYAASDHPISVTQAIASLTSIEYQDGQHGLETQKQKGILLVGPDSLSLATQVNEIKARLGDEFTTLRARLNKNTSISDAIAQQDAIRRILARAGVGRFCANQAKRLLPISEQAPHRISWLSKTNRSIKRVTHDEAVKKLMKLSSAQAHIDLEKLQNMSSDLELAIVATSSSPTMKATIFYPAVVDGQKVNRRVQMHAPVPILCATGNVMPALHKGGSRQNTPRSDYKISKEVFLPSIRAHLYENDLGRVA